MLPSDVYDSIPKGYFLGVSHPHALLICQILQWIGVAGPQKDDHENTLILDIGSGKGYIDRILSGHYGIPVFCVDKAAERLKSSSRLHALLKSDSKLDPELKALSSLSLVRNYACSITCLEDYNEVCDKAVQFFQTVQNKREVPRIVVIGLKLCGDMFYDLAEWHTRSALLTRYSDVRLHIVPCCPHRSFRGGNIEQMVSFAESLGWGSVFTVALQTPYAGIELRSSHRCLSYSGNTAALNSRAG